MKFRKSIIPHKVMLSSHCSWYIYNRVNTVGTAMLHNWLHEK